MGNYPDKHRHTGFSVGAVILLTVLVSCQEAVRPLSNQSAAGVTQPSKSPERSPEVEKSVTELITELPFLEKGERLGLLRAWTRVPEHDNFRAAQASDFENPFLTHEYGEMACLRPDRFDCGQNPRRGSIQSGHSRKTAGESIRPLLDISKHGFIQVSYESFQWRYFCRLST
jgi:hypothetical protein